MVDNNNKNISFSRQTYLLAINRIKWLLNIHGFCPGPNLSKRLHKKYLYPHLLRGLKIDWYSRYIVGYSFSKTLERTFITDTINKAIKRHGAPEIMNCDQGKQFTSDDYINLLKQHNIKISMDGKGLALDNQRIYRFFRSYKWEKLYLEEYEIGHVLKRITRDYVGHYNNYRFHQSLNYQVPAYYYFRKSGSLQEAV